MSTRVFYLLSQLENQAKKCYSTLKFNVFYFTLITYFNVCNKLLILLFYNTFFCHIKTQFSMIKKSSLSL